MFETWSTLLMYLTRRNLSTPDTFGSSAWAIETSLVGRLRRNESSVLPRDECPQIAQTAPGGKSFGG
jgi:hypothetical protein